MKFLFRWLFRLFLFSIVVAVAALLLRDTLLKAYLEQKIRAATGLDLQIGSLRTGLFEPAITLREVTLHYGADRGGRLFAEIPEIHALLDWRSLRAREIHCKLFRINIRDLVIVENGPEGASLTGLLGGLSTNGTISETAEKLFPQAKFRGVDSLNISLGRLQYLDLKKPDRVEEARLDLDNEVFSGVTSVKDFCDALLTRLFQKGIVITAPKER